MEKLRLYGLKKSEKHNVFYIEKGKIFLEKFRECLHNLGFKSHETIDILSLLGDADDNYQKRKYSNKLYQDEYFYFENNEYKVEVFFGKDKVIISIFTESDKQEEIMKQINKFCTLTT